MSMELEPIPRTVKPRQTGYTHRPLLAVRHGQCMTENGAVGEVSRLDWKRLESVTVVGVNLPHFIAGLDERYRDDPDWNWRARDNDMKVGQIATQARTIVDFFGWKNGGGGGNR